MPGALPGDLGISCSGSLNRTLCGAQVRQCLAAAPRARLDTVGPPSIPSSSPPILSPLGLVQAVGDWQELSHGVSYMAFTVMWHALGARKSMQHVPFSQSHLGGGRRGCPKKNNCGGLRHTGSFYQPPLRHGSDTGSRSWQIGLTLLESSYNMFQES